VYLATNRVSEKRLVGSYELAGKIPRREERLVREHAPEPRIPSMPAERAHIQPDTLQRYTFMHESSGGKYSIIHDRPVNVRAENCIFKNQISS
jgi:hypothetical protein